jgi:23S rRNA pseudouridine1911/1915/1917 synthase
LKHDTGNGTLLGWCAARFPELYAVQGRNPWEGGILHRLDYETQGLVLFAKTQAAMDALYAQQEKGLFVKEYQGLSVPNTVPLSGFPLKPLIGTVPFTIESGFRSYSKGQAAVRPVVSRAGQGSKRNTLKAVVLDQGNPYRTKVLEMRTAEGCVSFHVQIKRGFRHQIRCHLAWIGFPLLNDRLYGGMVWEEAPLKTKDFATMALIARGISFYDPVSGNLRQYTIPGFQHFM